MSYKLNQQDPTRRQRLLDRRKPNDYPLAHTYPSPVYKTGFKMARQQPAGAYGPTPMKRSRRHAMIRRITRAVEDKKITEKYGALLIRLAFNGSLTRADVYGTHPTRRTNVKRRA
jgi:hypothetical protein